MFNLFSKTKTDYPPVFFYNSATGKKELFTPLRKDVTVYACGPTVYDHIHIGNLRAYLLPDLVKRLFLYQDQKVKLTINFTDFGHLSDDGDDGEDKIMKGMKREGYDITLDNMLEFVKPYIQSFKRDNEQFGNLTADTYARASDYISQQIKLIETLEQKGYTYTTSDGVYFDIGKYPEYGRLGNINLEEIRSGARVAVNTEKKHPADFALWKLADLGWKSKWGQGFPGWHSECVAMAFSTLGKQIDIHTGGEDLMYTHHNGEIAQAECVTGKSFSQFWLHNAHITVKDAKFAKSAGNSITLRELVEKGYTPSDYRYWLLTGHYRTRLDFSFEALDGAKQALTRLKRFVYEEYEGITPTVIDPAYETKFITALHDDLDTPKIIAILWEVVKDDKLKHGAKLATIHAIDSVLEIGLSESNADGTAALGYLEPNDIPTAVQTLLDERAAARAARNWPESDRLREAITHAGFEVEDAAEGTKIKKL